MDAGASTGISLGFSFGFSYSKKEGLSIGFTKTGALGSFVGINASANLQLSFSPTASSMSKLGGTSIVVGGSKGAGLSVGGSVAIPPDAEKGSAMYSASIGVSAGGLAEGHVYVAQTLVTSWCLRNGREKSEKIETEEVIFMEKNDNE